MSVVFHPLPTSCATTAHGNQSSPAHHAPRQSMGLRRLSPLSLLSCCSSSPTHFRHLSLRCFYHHPSPPDTKTRLTAASLRPTSAWHPRLSRIIPLSGAQPCRCSGSDDSVSVMVRHTRLLTSGGAHDCAFPDGATIAWGARVGASPSRRQQSFTPRVAGGGRPTNTKKEDKLVTEGLITELLPNCMFRVRLDNGEVILGYVSGKMRTKMVRVMVGDRVRIEVSRYDSSRGRIVYRLRSKSTTE